MSELGYKEGRVLKNWCFQIVVLERTPESPSDGKDIKPNSPIGNQPWIFTRRTDAEANAPIHWLPDAKCQLIKKGPELGAYWREKEKGAAKDEMVRWHNQLSGHEFVQNPRDSKGLTSWVGHEFTTKQQQIWII